MITEKCGIYNLIEKGDNVMADKGFDIADSLSCKGATTNTPQFLGQCKHLAATDVEELCCIVDLCIHVERATGRAINYES